jgi:hypothetical protein
MCASPFDVERSKGRGERSEVLMSGSHSGRNSRANVVHDKISRRPALSVTKISLLLIGGGLLWIGAEYVEDRNHPRRHVVPSESDLASVSGELVGARVVDIKSKKNVLAAHYTELDIKDADRVITVRVGAPHTERDLEGLSQTSVDAKFDAADEMKVYALSAGDREVIRYADSAAYKAKLVESNSGGSWLGWLAVAIGAAGLWLDRKTAAAR